MERFNSVKKVARTLSGRSKKDKKEKKDKYAVPWLQEKDGAWLCPNGHHNYLIYQPSKEEPFEPIKCYVVSCKSAISNPCYTTNILKHMDKDAYLEEIGRWRGHAPRLGLLGVVCCKCGKSHRAMSLRGDQQAVTFDEILGKQECDCGNKSDSQWAKTFNNWIFFEVGSREDFRQDSGRAIALLQEQRDHDLGLSVDPNAEVPEWMRDYRNYEY